MKLRPHHLLCTQAYRGKGYSDTFVEHMNEVVGKLRGNIPVEIELVKGTDILCSACPHNMGENRCETDEKVKRFDSKVMEYFNLEEKTYIYQELIKRIDQEMTEEKIADICNGCSWQAICACRENILNKV